MHQSQHALHPVRVWGVCVMIIIPTQANRCMCLHVTLLISMDFVRLDSFTVAITKTHHLTVAQGKTKRQRQRDTWCFPSDLKFPWWTMTVEETIMSKHTIDHLVLLTLSSLCRLIYQPLDRQPKRSLWGLDQIGLQTLRCSFFFSLLREWFSVSFCE
jgi:hypothetical protein